MPRLGKFSKRFAKARNILFPRFQRLRARFPHAPAATLRVVHKRFWHGRVPHGIVASLDVDDDLETGDSLGNISSGSETPLFMRSPDDNRDSLCSQDEYETILTKETTAHEQPGTQGLALQRIQWLSLWQEELSVAATRVAATDID